MHPLKAAVRATQIAKQRCGRGPVRRKKDNAENIRGANLPFSIRPSSSAKNPKHSIPYGPYPRLINEIAHGWYRDWIVTPDDSANEHPATFVVIVHTFDEFVLCRNPIHDSGALLKAARSAESRPGYRSIFQAREVAATGSGLVGHRTGNATTTVVVPSTTMVANLTTCAAELYL